MALLARREEKSRRGQTKRDETRRDDRTLPELAHGTDRHALTARLGGEEQPRRGWTYYLLYQSTSDDATPSIAALLHLSAIYRVFI
jgi:hypothetical protein